VYTIGVLAFPTEGQAAAFLALLVVLAIRIRRLRTPPPRSEQLAQPQ
jgi:hypothetical protein